jgi:hypothetical protein
MKVQISLEQLTLLEGADETYLEAPGGKLELRVHFDRMDVALGLPVPTRK